MFSRWTTKAVRSVVLIRRNDVVLNDSEMNFAMEQCPRDKFIHRLSNTHNLDRLMTQISEYVSEAREDRKSLQAAIESLNRLMDY